MKLARAVVVRPTYRSGEIALRAASNPSINIRKALQTAGFEVGERVVVLLEDDYERLAALETPRLEIA